jgi:hypothetical protein
MLIINDLKFFLLERAHSRHLLERRAGAERIDSLRLIFLQKINLKKAHRSEGFKTL